MPDFVNDNLNGAEFEASVRHVARQLYRHASSSGSIKLDDRERDEIIDTGTELIIVEATQSRKLEKIKGDLKKSIELVKMLRTSPKFSEYNFRIMLVTADDPTADQNEYVKSSKAGCPKEIISLTTLFSRLFDARHYIRVRGDHSFGSVRDPANEHNYKVPPSEYIATALSRESTGESIKASELATRLEGSGLYVIYGDYGSGKSMTLRDIYFKARDHFISGKLLRCPVYLNLRTIELGRSSTEKDSRNFLHFHDCVIDRIEGAASERDVPAGVLTGKTSVENYAAFTATNEAVMRSALPNEVKVLITILRKLFMQRGTGRQYSALRRGLPIGLVKHVDPIIAQIKAEAFAEDVYLDRRTILIPNRSRSADALAIINGPNTSTHPLIERVRRG
jgi:hypothetical protein